MTCLKYAFVLCASAVAMSPALACYTVYGPANQVVYAGAQAPIDMSYQIHERLPAMFPGGHMVFGNSTDCTPIDNRANAVNATPGGMAMSARTRATRVAVSRQRARRTR